MRCGAPRVAMHSAGRRLLHDATDATSSCRPQVRSCVCCCAPAQRRAIRLACVLCADLSVSTPCAAPGHRRFTSSSINSVIASYTPRFLDSNIATLFANCLPNTLDTTVQQYATSPPLDTFIITGDIAAMWLRDSANQVAPYIDFIAKDTALMQLVAGVINRHAHSVLLDPVRVGVARLHQAMHRLHAVGWS